MVGRGTRSRADWRATLSALIVACAVGHASAQIEPRIRPQPQEDSAKVQTPDLAEPVLRLLEATYLTDDERKDLRVFHGVWKDGDLDTPQRRARAALIRGTPDDPSLSDPAVAPEDRADAALARGDLDDAIKLAGDSDSARAIRIRAEALEGLGKTDAAAAAIEPLVERLKSKQVTTPEELVESVRALILRSRVRPQEEPAGGDFRQMEALLALCRDQLGRLYWPAYVTEARLLYDKDNTKDAGAAVMRALSLNPSSAEAWELLGRMGVDSFNFEGVEEVAAKLDALAGGPSPKAAAVLARARLRQNDPDGAAALIEPQLLRYPKLRDLLAVQAATMALRYDFDATDKLLAAFDTLSPGSPDALYEVGKTLSEARQYEEASFYLSKAAARAPYRAEAVCDLGLLGLQSGRDTEARDALERAAALDPFNLRVANSLALVKELTGFHRVESDHFIIRYKPGPDEALALDMPARLETMYKRVTGKGPGGIDHQPGGKTVIDLMPNQRWFAVRIAGVTRIHTMAASTGPTIAMESPSEGPGHSIGTYDWLRVVRHEFTHTVTLSRSKNRMPHWFTEASAVYLEDSPRDYNTCKLLEGALDNDALLDFREINIAFVRPKKQTDRSLAYAQGHWMYQFMIEKWGQKSPLQLMDLYAAGKREDAAFRQVFGVGTAEFTDQFRAWARKQLVAWGMVPREGEPTLGQVLLEEATSAEDTRKGMTTELQAAADDAAWSAAIGGGPDTEWKPELPHPSKAMADRWLQKYPDHPDLLQAEVAYAVAAADDKPGPDLVPLLERYAAARPVDPLPHQLLARIYLALEPGQKIGDKGIEGAIPHLEYLDAREQGSATYAAELARRYAAIQDWDKAAAKAERATTIAPYNADYRELAATVALQHNDYPTALRQITALTIIEPTREIHKRRLEAVKAKMGRPG